MKKKGWGFDVRDIEKSIRPQDDFFHYASGAWMKRHPIPKAESCWGSFTKLRHTTDTQLRELVTTLEKKTNVVRGTPEQLIRDLHRSGMDLKRRSALGLSPLKKELDRIACIKTPQDLVQTFAEFDRSGVGGIWGIGVDQDMKNSDKYILYIGQGGLGMPDRDYYLNSDAESLRVRAAYQKHLEQLSLLSGDTKEVAKKNAANILKLETALARISMKKEEVRDVDKTYHKMSFGKLAKLTPHINWREYFHIIGAPLEDVVVMQPKFLSSAQTLLSTTSIDTWKTYLRIHLIGGFSSFLTPSLAKETFAFYGTALTGTKHMQPVWRRVLRTVNGSLGEPVGKLYVETYFGTEAKKKVVEIVADLFAAYKARIQQLDWMSEGTKKKALLKLAAMNRKLGYPDKWKTYKGLEIREDSYVQNLMNISRFEHKRAMGRLKKPVDRKEWFMSPQTVNAYCSFGLNDIVFPAAILQHPFFDVSADDAFNYGAIGSVIGHEITHGFDDQGAKFDGKGDRKTWWTKTDRARFDKKAARVVKEFNGYEVESGLHVNGKLTLGENIADLGGLSIAYDAYQLRLAKNPSKTIAGFTPAQRFFLAYANTEREQERPEFRKTQVLTNPHSPALFRVNGPLSNLPEFYEAFGVKKGDKLYREPKDRAKIW
jgi:putative endopeptidase